MRINLFLPLGVVVAAVSLVACGGNDGSTAAGNGGAPITSSTGGHANAGASATGGATSTNTSTGVTTGGQGTAGSTSTSVVTTGGAPPTTSGGAPTSTGGTGTTTTGGTKATGGTSGTSVVTTGGAPTSTGGTGTTTTGGTKATGGTTSTTTSVSTGGVTATGGTKATGGTTAAATGGATTATVTPATPSCPTGNNSEGVPNAANPPVANVISDFNNAGDATNYPCVPDPNHLANPCSDSHLIVYKQGGRGGTLWYGYTDYTATPDSSTTVASSLPTLSWDGTQGVCTSGGSMHVKGTGNTGWGSGIGVDLMQRNASNQKVPYNASAYTGIGFNMKCASDVGYIYFKLIDAVNDGDCNATSCGIGSVCVYSGTGTICNQYGYKNAWVTKNWSNYELYFADALQDPNAALSTTATVPDKTKLTALQMQFNTGYDTSGSNKVATSFECWIDDVHFLTGNPPTPQTTCASGAYTTSGNKIMCGSTQKIFRGVARPSMEWDTSGWNVMPWDMARIKNGWKANLVRIGMNQDFYMGTSVASNGTIYPKYIARAARWAESYGLDVILDLHWVDAAHPSSTSGYMAGPSTNSPAFWTAVATAFKSDNHVMFELYNEPTVSDWATWKTNYQALYNAVRNTPASATQIVILGGLDWAYDLSGLPANAISGTNIVYNTHPYANKAPSSDWPAKFGTLAATYPVMATEFGSYDCTGTWTTSLITYMEGLGMSWTAWGWYAGGGCSFPSLISSYDGTSLAGGNADASRTVMASKN